MLLPRRAARRPKRNSPRAMKDGCFSMSARIILLLAISGSAGFAFITAPSSPPCFSAAILQDVAAFCSRGAVVVDGRRHSSFSMTPRIMIPPARSACFSGPKCAHGDDALAVTSSHFISLRHGRAEYTLSLMDASYHPSQQRFRLRSISRDHFRLSVSRQEPAAGSSLHSSSRLSLLAWAEDDAIATSAMTRVSLGPRLHMIPA